MTEYFIKTIAAEKPEDLMAYALQCVLPLNLGASTANPADLLQNRLEAIKDGFVYMTKRRGKMRQRRSYRKYESFAGVLDAES